MERRIRIFVTIGMLAALIGLMFITVEPEVDLSVDQLMESPEQYAGDTFRLHGSVLSMDMNNDSLSLQGVNHTIVIDFSGASLPSGVDEGKTISVRGELTGSGEDWTMH
ncbi:MAG: cytochrome c maturation protein CcmE, partial [Candidatus Poseidoniales archaeon]|nr:cytochrome c maturation protein CcmE [Candidatus Poseidoniales archaeon]